MERVFKGTSLLEFPQDYTVIDLETTGLDPQFCEIIEVAAVRCRGGQEVSRFQTLVKPEYEVDEFITALTGITNEMLSDAPPIKAVLPDFLNYVGNDIVVGHNVNFDINFIYDFAQLLGMGDFSNNYVDTMRMSRRLFPNLPHHRLSDVSEHLGTLSGDAHRALADCLSVVMCYETMREKSLEVGGIPKSASESWRSMAKTLTPETSDFNADSPVYGRTFAFTGTLERMSRKEAMQAVINAGGQCTDNVVSNTNFLVLGNNDFCASIKGGKSNKQKKAEKMRLKGADIEVISENAFYDMLEE